MSLGSTPAAYLFDAGGVLVLPDPTVLGPLLRVFGADPDHETHRRAHYAGMAAKSRARADEHDWAVYDRAYVEMIGVPAHDVDEAAMVLGHTRTPYLWRFPIDESVAALRDMARRGEAIGVVSNASGQVEAALRRAAVCQVGGGPGAPVRCVIDSFLVGVAKPDPSIFEHALVHLDGIDRSEIAYIGDSVTMDVEGAAAAGLRPILLDPFDDHPGLGVERIRSLAELVT